MCSRLRRHAGIERRTGKQQSEPQPMALASAAACESALRAIKPGLEARGFNRLSGVAQVSVLPTYLLKNAIVRSQPAWPPAHRTAASCRCEAVLRAG